MKRVVLKICSMQHLIDCSKREPDALWVCLESWSVAKAGVGITLTKPVAQMLFILYAREGRVTPGEIMDFLYGDREDGGPYPKIIDVYLTRLRKIAPLLGIKIHTAWGVGLELEAA